MASNIKYQTIDEGFPVAGEDNNSQGFRDNFNIIKTSLSDAQAEVTDLQDNAARKDENNNFANNSLINANLDTVTFKAIVGGTQTQDSEVNIVNGHYQTYVIGGDVTLTLSGWPNNNYSSMVVDVIANDQGPHTVSFEGEPTNTKILKESSSVWESSSTVTNADVVITSETAHRLFEFWTYDNGETIYVKHLGDFE